MTEPMTREQIHALVDLGLPRREAQVLNCMISYAYPVTARELDSAGCSRASSRLCDLWRRGLVKRVGFQKNGETPRAARWWFTLRALPTRSHQRIDVDDIPDVPRNVKERVAAEARWLAERWAALPEQVDEMAADIGVRMLVVLQPPPKKVEPETVQAKQLSII